MISQTNFKSKAWSYFYMMSVIDAIGGEDQHGRPGRCVAAAKSRRRFGHLRHHAGKVHQGQCRGELLLLFSFQYDNNLVKVFAEWFLCVQCCALAITRMPIIFPSHLTVIVGMSATHSLMHSCITGGRHQTLPRSAGQDRRRNQRPEAGHGAKRRSLARERNWSSFLTREIIRRG